MNHAASLWKGSILNSLFILKNSRLWLRILCFLDHRPFFFLGSWLWRKCMPMPCWAITLMLSDTTLHGLKMTIWLYRMSTVMVGEMVTKLHGWSCFCLLVSWYFLGVFWAIGGSLHDAITEKGEQGEFFSVPELRDLLLQVSMGLKYIHNSGLVHLDIKPSELCASLIVSPLLFFTGT